MKHLIILTFALLFISCAKTETVQTPSNMPNNTFQSFPYPANSPSKNGYSYLCFGVNGESTFADYKDWVADAWVLNEGDTVQSFVEIGRKLIE